MATKKTRQKKSRPAEPPAPAPSEKRSETESQIYILPAYVENHQPHARMLREALSLGVDAVRTVLQCGQYEVHRVAYDRLVVSTPVVGRHLGEAVLVVSLATEFTVRVWEHTVGSVERDVRLLSHPTGPLITLLDSDVSIEDFPFTTAPQRASEISALRKVALLRHLFGRPVP